MKQTLFLQPPSFDGFGGGAGSRYQATREICSFWYSTWLAQPASLVPGSRVLDAPADGLCVEATLDIAARYERAVIHTSTPSFPTDALFERFHSRFYFRPSKIWEIVREMLMSWHMMKRRLREGAGSFRFLHAHEA